MANLVVGAAGAAVGGPIGGALGAMLGRQVDRSFGRSAASRLSDLRTPSTQYGDPIPAILGHMRVAGVVLWTAPPVATASVSKSGTSQGSSVSFAYGLSSGQIESVGRIWADGRLIRDRDGQQAVTFELRLHHGTEDQLSDPLIASIVGERHAPAFRGIAYLLFEDFDLSTFGNRLPIITVEVSGATGPMYVEEVLGQQLGLSSGETEPVYLLEGYAHSADDLAFSLSPICSAFEPFFAHDEGGWRLGKGSIHHFIDEPLWSLEQHAGRATALGGLRDQPTKVSVRYFDPDLDFAAGEKAVRLPGVERLRRIELPAALTGECAKAVAFEQLAKQAGKYEQHWLRLPLSYYSINLGDTISRAGTAERPYTVCTKLLEAGELKLGLRRQIPSPPSFEVESRGAAAFAKLQREPLEISAIEMPGAMFETEPALLVLVSGGHVPFQAMPLTITINGAQQVRKSAEAPCARGMLLNSLPYSSAEVLDKRNKLVVGFGADPMLSSCDEEALLAGANLAWVDGEFIQFATAKAQGDAKYEISDLVRGRFDSGRKISHSVGSEFILLDPLTSTLIKAPQESIGASFSVRAYGPDNQVADENLLIAGLAARPWAPVRLRVVETLEGLQATWIARCKEAVPWLDNVGSPVGSSREIYHVRVTDPSGGSVDAHTNEPAVLIDAQALAKLGPRPWILTVRQLGDFAAGREADLTLN